jgi:hypothetical protein
MLSEGEINGTLLNCDSCAWQCFHASKSVFYVFKIFNTNDSLIKILKAFDFIQKINIHGSKILFYVEGYFDYPV